mgnify:CR=1 FL=1
MLRDKVILVTGGAGLIGQEFIRGVIENNGIAIIADNDENLGLRFQNKISSEFNTNNIDFVKLDITSSKSIMDAISYAENKYTKIDALVNNAYPRNENYGRHFFDVTYEDFSENLSSNLGGYFLTSQKFSQFFNKQGYGNIINISSVYGVIAPRFSIYKNTNMTTPVEYAVIKAGLIHLTKYMATYFKGMNIRVNSLSPGGVRDSQPGSFIQNYKDHCLNKGLLDKSDLKGTLVYLLSDLSTNLNGQNIVVDDGFVL